MFYLIAMVVVIIFLVIIARTKSVWLKLVLTAPVLAVCVLEMWPDKDNKASSEGVCERGAQRSDAEFIRYALTTFAGYELEHIGKSGSRVAAGEFLAAHPDCCAVFRSRPSELSDVHSVMWVRSVVVRIVFGSESRAKSELPNRIPAILYVLVDNCLNGGERLRESRESVASNGKAAR